MKAEGYFRGSTYVLALRDSTESNLDLGLGQDVGGGGHVDEEVYMGESRWLAWITPKLHSSTQQFDPQIQLSEAVSIHFIPQTTTKVLPTLNSRLGANSGSQTHSTSHEVGEDLVGARSIAGLVFAEIGDLQGRATLLSGGEGALERGLRIGDSPPLLAGGDGGAGGGQLLAGASAQQSAGSGGERHGDAIDHGVGC